MEASDKNKKLANLTVAPCRITRKGTKEIKTQRTQEYNRKATPRKTPEKDSARKGSDRRLRGKEVRTH